MSTVTSTAAANGYSTYFPTPFHLQQQPYIGPAPSPFAPPVYSAPAAISGVYSLPQYQQAQQLFQRVAQTITPEAIENVKAAIASSEIDQKAEAKRKAVPRKAAGQTWEDPTLADWPENDFRLFCGNLGNEVVRDKRTGNTKGYGFVSFSNPLDLVVALKEMNGKYVGNRPIQLRKSKWKERIDYEALVKREECVSKESKVDNKEHIAQVSVKFFEYIAMFRVEDSKSLNVISVSTWGNLLALWNRSLFVHTHCDIYVVIHKLCIIGRIIVPMFVQNPKQSSICYG